MSLDSLHPNGLYIILFIRQDPPVLNDLHWGLYLHRDGSGGTKYHIKSQGSGWIADHGVIADIFKSFLLVGLFLIAKIPAEWETRVVGLIRESSIQLNTPGTTCRVWLFRVLELLQKPENSYKVLKCDKLAALQTEVMDFGNAYAGGAAANEQPRPVGASTICGL
ncbi:hypothetical protein MMC24_003451 [Lignoscripta atroalba]|nr:hypothetical protein [Lignoscripta atroalba]